MDSMGPSSDGEQVKANEDLCFVAMPFSKDLTEVYIAAIQQAAKSTSSNMRCLRADEISGSGSILSQVEASIRQAAVVVADLSGGNPNVLYELGYARGAGKEAIILSQSEDSIPSNLRDIRHIPYENSTDGIEMLKWKVKDDLRAVMRDEVRTVDQHAGSEDAVRLYPRREKSAYRLPKLKPLVYMCLSALLGAALVLAIPRVVRAVRSSGSAAVDLSQAGHHPNGGEWEVVLGPSDEVTRRRPMRFGGLLLYVPEDSSKTVADTRILRSSGEYDSSDIPRANLAPKESMNFRQEAYEYEVTLEEFKRSGKLAYTVRRRPLRESGDRSK